jgi:formate hydrogenlyase transcriptional activator
MPKPSTIDFQRELLLSHFTIENLQEAVFWVNSQGNILQVNARACELTGYSKEELLCKGVLDINPSEVVMDFPKFWKRLKKEKKITFEAKHKHKSGYLYDVEITGNFIEYEGQEFSCSIVRDTKRKRLEEETLRIISEATSGLTGKDFFIELAKHITVSLSMRYALITQCANEDKTRLRTICYVDGKKMLDNVEYDTTGIPCEIIMRGEDFFMARGVEEYFPKEKGIQSYVGVPIHSPSSGEILGHIIAVDPNPVTDEKNQTAILKIFASRAGAELDRLDALRKLEVANEELKLRVREIESLKNQLALENKYLQEEIKLNHNFDEIISKSKNFQKVLQQIEQVASTDATVLILGESGTGKELIARATHNISNRNRRPLVKINCATLPANLIESELFGHEKGAFTGAMDRKIGRFELADGGTIFLDEIGELPIELQAKLLRVLQEGEFERLGNPKTMKVNVRVIAATNRNLELAIEKKEFRQDLFYRLNVFPIVCPPLRERKEDIPLLVKHFCQKHEARIGKKITNIPSKVMDLLMVYDWPGNIRELENIIERALILSKENTLEYGEWMPSHKKQSLNTGVQTLEDVEKKHIIQTLQTTKWKVSGENGAANILGLNPTTLEARMKRLGIKRES